MDLVFMMCHPRLKLISQLWLPEPVGSENMTVSHEKIHDVERKSVIARRSPDRNPTRPERRF